MRFLWLGLILLGAATTTNYLLEYMTTYASVTLRMPASIAFGATAVIGLSGVICDPLGGWLSDRFGRKPIMIVPWLLLAVVVFPAFWMLDQLRSGPALYTACAVLACTSTLSSGTIIVAITEALPQRVRAGGIALIYALAISVFGGSAQFLVTWLIRSNRQSPGARVVHARRHRDRADHSVPAAGDRAGEDCWHPWRTAPHSRQGSVEISTYNGGYFYGVSLPPLCALEVRCNRLPSRQQGTLGKCRF